MGSALVLVLAGAGVGAYFWVSAGTGLPYSPFELTRAQIRVNQLSAAAGCPGSTLAEPKKPSWRLPPERVVDTADTYTATFTTDSGSFTVTLDPARAPRAVNSFVFLAEHGFYNCLTFYRARPVAVFADGRVEPLDGFAESGDPTATGAGGPGYLFTDRAPAAPGARAGAGTVVMVDMHGPGAPPAYGSQFSVLLGTTASERPTPFPPGSEPIGTVTSGLAVLEGISTDGNATPGVDGLPPRVVHRIFDVTIGDQ